MAEYVLHGNYQPFDKQLAFHQSDKRFKIATAGNRSGKTVVGAEEFVESVFADLEAGKGKQPKRIGNIRVPRLAYWVVTPTYDLGEFPFREIVRAVPNSLIEKINASTREMWWKGGIHVDFKSTERPERLVAASLNGIWMDEAPRCKAEAWRGGLRARLADQSGWALFTGSPLGGRNNWVYQDLVAKQGIDPLIDAFSWTTADNPHIPREEIEHAKATLPAAWYARDWDASWDSFGGAIYEEFNDAIHVTDEQRFRFEFGLGNRPLAQCFNKVVSAIDFGHQCGAMLTVGELGDGNWVVLDEVYRGGIRPVSGSSETWLDHIKRVSKDYGARSFVGDPEDAGALFDLRNNGVPIQPAVKQVYLGIRRVASAIHVNPMTRKPGLRIFSHCKNLIRELRSYQWKPNREQTGFLDEPAPNQDDHACDALRYAAMELRLYDYVERARHGGDASVRMGQ